MHTTLLLPAILAVQTMASSGPLATRLWAIEYNELVSKPPPGELAFDMRIMSAVHTLLAAICDQEQESLDRNLFNTVSAYLGAFNRNLQNVWNSASPLSYYAIRARTWADFGEGQLPLIDPKGHTHPFLRDAIVPNEAGTSLYADMSAGMLATRYAFEQQIALDVFNSSDIQLPLLRSYAANAVHRATRQRFFRLCMERLFEQDTLSLASLHQLLMEPHVPVHYMLSFAFVDQFRQHMRKMRTVAKMLLMLQRHWPWCCPQYGTAVVFIECRLEDQYKLLEDPAFWRPRLLINIACFYTRVSRILHHPEALPDLCWPPAQQLTWLGQRYGLSNDAADIERGLKGMNSLSAFFAETRTPEEFFGRLLWTYLAQLVTFEAAEEEESVRSLHLRARLLDSMHLIYAQLTRVQASKFW